MKRRLARTTLVALIALVVGPVAWVPHAGAQTDPNTPTLTLHGMGQEVESLADGERGLHERLAFGRTHGAGEHFVVARRLGALQAVEDRRPAQGDVGSDDQMGDVLSAAPRSESGPGVPETQGLLSHGHMPG